MVTRFVFLVLVAAFSVQRLVELAKSRRHAERLLAQGGVEHAPYQLFVMIVVHTCWFLGMVGEVFLTNRPFQPIVATVGFVLLATGQWLRYTSMRALGGRWTARVITLPNAPIVTSGLYRHIKHPIYLGVALEIAGLPLIHSAYVTAIAASIVNTAVLLWRIDTEERALGIGKYASLQKSAENP